MTILLLSTAALFAASPPTFPAEGLRGSPIPPPAMRADRPAPPFGDTLGDAWEMEEVAEWRGVWLRRDTGGRARQTTMFDGYWYHPNGERVRAPLEMWADGRSVIAVRRHPSGQYCRYDGTISGDWWHIEGHYTCTWERSPMRWRAQIVRLEHSEPALLRRR